MSQVQPIWNDASLQKPRNSSVPIQRKLLNQDLDLNSFPYSQLIGNLKNFQKKEIWSEAYMAFRVYCLNYNQHRQTVHFRKFSRFIQILKRFQGLGLDKHAQELLNQFHHTTTSDKKRPWTHLPDPEYTKHALLKFTGVFHLSALCIQVSEEVHCSATSLLTRFDFMHTAAILLSMASRVKIISQLWKDSSETIVYILGNTLDFYKTPIDIPASWGILVPLKGSLSRKKVLVSEYELQSGTISTSKGAFKKRCLR